LDAPGNVLIQKKESKLIDDSVIIVVQLYAIDRERFKKKVSKVTKEIMLQVEIGMKLVLGLNQ
jgi:mRNA-degrading endonuclease toxin of MazEF toxin-antitoxin module